MLGAMLGTIPGVSDWILILILSGKSNVTPFYRCASEAQRGRVTCLKSHNWPEVQQGYGAIYSLSPEPELLFRPVLPQKAAADYMWGSTFTFILIKSMDMDKTQTSVGMK